jgi:hypothetical protein
MKPTFKPIPGYDGKYLVSNCGKVYSCKRKKFMKPKDHNRGYLHVNLYKDGKAKTVTVHRLVANAFCEISKDATEINHKDGNKKNNHYTNLEWVTSSENKKHSYRVLGRKTRVPSKRVAQLRTGSNETVAVFPSASEAARKTGLHQPSISAAARGARKTTGGFRWLYV